MKRPRLAPPRLLPVVIFAALALLGFKAVGLVTHGSYVLTGTEPAAAAEGEAGPGAGVEPTASNPNPGAEPTMADTSPTLTDTAPTLATKPEGEAGHAEEAGVPKAGEGAGPSAAKDGDAAPAAASADTAALKPAADPGPCLPGAAATVSGTGPAEATGTPGANCDAVPMTIAADGHTVPLAAQGGGSLTEQTLLERLGERRAELDKRAAALDMREAVIKAAEKQMQDRADALKALEARIAELDTQKKSMEDTQFAALVKMYETMKPQEAAAIFDGLDMGVLQRVAEAMDPRKMSPILAKMSSARAQQLTTALAGADPRAATTLAATDPGALPQIVGH